jgi:hypothetical protein
MNLTEQLANESLEPLIRHAQQNPGTVTTLAARIMELTGEKQYRQNVGAWLHPDAKLRIEPRFGMGLLLLRLWDTELRPGAAAKKPRKQPKKRMKTRLSSAC